MPAMMARQLSNRGKWSRAWPAPTDIIVLNLIAVSPKPALDAANAVSMAQDVAEQLCLFTLFNFHSLANIKVLPDKQLQNKGYILGWLGRQDFEGLDNCFRIIRPCLQETKWSLSAFLL